MNILIAGDFCPQNRVAQLFEEGDFSSVFGEVMPVIDKADYSIVNFECPITCGDEKPIEKCGPNLQCYMSGIEAVKWVGFDCVTLANNHTLDYGPEGMKNTLDACCKCSIDAVGGGMNLHDAAKTLYKKVNGKTLAIINCCEHEFSIATDSTAGSNPLNPVQQYYAIREARRTADYVLVIVHGGHEHYQLPSLRMVETYRFFIDAGADAVVNHHQHCFSGYEFYNGKPIVYGLGNFCFDKNDGKYGKWNEGYMVSITFASEVKLDIIPYIQCAEEGIVKLAKPESFNEKLQELNDIIADQDRLSAEQQKYYESVRRSSRNVLNPVVNRYLSYLQYRHLLPDIVTEKWLKQVHNHVMCEAHRDKLIYYLNHRNQERK